MEKLRDYIELIWACSSTLGDAVGTWYMSRIKLHLCAEGPGPVVGPASTLNSRDFGRGPTQKVVGERKYMIQV